MAGNATPQFTKNGIFGTITVTGANTKSDGAGTIATDIFLAATADATNGSWVEAVRWIPTATAANTATGATVGRIFISTKTSGVTTSADTFLFAEVTLASQTADSSTNAVSPIDVPMNIRLPAGYTVLVTNHAAPAANTAWRANVIGGDY